MIKLVADILSRQDPNQPHTLLTRSIVSFAIVFATAVYFGFFGLIGAVAVYLLGVELMGLHLRWMYAPLALTLLIGLISSYRGLKDYWLNYGYG